MCLWPVETAYIALSILGVVEAKGVTTSAAPPQTMLLVLVAVAVLLVVVAFAYTQIRRRHRREVDALTVKATAIKTQLQQKVVEHEEVIDSFSRELRNSVNGLLGVSKMLSASELGARERYLLGMLQRCAERTALTTEAIGGWFAPAGSEKNSAHVPFELEPLLRTTMGVVDLDATKLAIESWDGPKIQVLGDAARYGQVLSQLLAWALGQGGASTANLRVRVKEVSLNYRVEVEIRYVGTAPAQNWLEARGSEKARQSAEKLALGLVLCRRYAEILGTKIAIGSEGTVTVLRVDQRFSPVQAIPAPKRQEHGAQHTQRPRALCVEDDDFNRLVVGDVIGQLGFQVDWAGDGKSALDLCEQNEYAIVLADWMLPDMSGDQLARRILASARASKPIILAVTAYADKEKRAESQAAGMSGFITKPVTLEKLQAALAELCVPMPSTRDATAEIPKVQVHVSLQRLKRVGPLERVGLEFAKKLEDDWADTIGLTKTDPGRAADSVHKLLSATLLVNAEYASDQLRLLETLLRENGDSADITALVEICGEEIPKVAQAVRTGSTC